MIQYWCLQPIVINHIASIIAISLTRRHLCQRLEAIPLFWGQFHKNLILYMPQHIRCYRKTSDILISNPERWVIWTCYYARRMVIHMFVQNLNFRCSINIWSIPRKCQFFCMKANISRATIYLTRIHFVKVICQKKHELVCSCEYSSSGLVSLDSPMLLMFRRWNLSVNGPRNIIKVPIIASLRLCARKHLAQPSVDSQQMA